MPGVAGVRKPVVGTISQDVMNEATDGMSQEESLRDAVTQLCDQLHAERRDRQLLSVTVDSDDRDIQALAGLINDLLRDAQDPTVRQRTAELEQAKVVAEMGSIAKSKFLTRMSHELRTPLNSIIGFAQLLLDSKKEPLSEHQGKQVGHILRGGRHLQGLINDVLDLSAIENDKLDLNIEAVDMDEVIAESLQMISPLIETHDVTFENGIAADFEMPCVSADFLRTKQCLINLLSNACKYNKPGGKVWIKACIFKDESLRISVGDSGLGIPENRQHELFRPFSRLGREESDVEGSGVGLVLTRHLIHAMEGILDYESVEGEGSSFWFDLPMTERPAFASNRSELTSVQLDKRPQGVVLYVEDIASNMALMEDILREYTDVDVLTASTAEEGIALALEQLPDLIIMDLNLTGMNGIDATRYIRTVSSTQNIPVYALTGDVQENTRTRCDEAGIDRFFTKPFDVSEFIDAVSDALEQRLGKLL